MTGLNAPDVSRSDSQEPQKITVNTRFGVAFKDQSDGVWFFQSNPHRIGTPPVRPLSEVAQGIEGEYREEFCREVNRAMEESGQHARLIGDSINPRKYFG